MPPEVIRGRTIAPSVPTDLEACLLRCLAKDAADRSAAAGDLGETLCACESAEAWTREDAERWWEVHGTALSNGREAERSG